MIFFSLAFIYFISANNEKSYRFFRYRGVGAMEIVAMDMKQRGLYMARQLSFEGVDFKIEKVPLTVDFKKMYDDSVKLVSLINCRIMLFRILISLKLLILIQIIF